MNVEDWTVDRRRGVTFVEVTVRNDRSTPQTVSLESRLDGPVWTPRRDGATPPEWTGGTWEATLAPGERRGVGFASPADPVDPPVEMAAARASPDRRDDPDAVLAGLDEWSPPGSVLPGGR